MCPVSEQRRSRQREGRKAGWPSVDALALRTVESMREKLPHPIWGIVAATLLAFVGPEYLLWRSVGLLIITVWLAVEFLAWWLPKRHLGRLRWMFGVTTASLMFIGMMVVMHWWMVGELQDQRDDVFRNLILSANMPQGSNNPFESIFTVTNSGGVGISKRRIACMPVTFTTVLGKKHTFKNIRFLFPGAWDVELLPGHSESDRCLLGWQTPSVCLDIELEVAYELVTQPTVTQRQLSRFVAYLIGNRFEWHEQPADRIDSYCQV
jgi:hypothetical protein